MNGVVTHFAQHRAPYIRPPGEKLEVDALLWTLLNSLPPGIQSSHSDTPPPQPLSPKTLFRRPCYPLLAIALHFFTRRHTI